MGQARGPVTPSVRQGASGTRLDPFACAHSTGQCHRKTANSSRGSKRTVCGALWSANEGTKFKSRRGQMLERSAVGTRVSLVAHGPEGNVEGSPVPGDCLGTLPLPTPPL